ncbi:MAG: YqcC family protein [Porticoccaceae bacterium]|nr:YqcC family protein [Porticoccaceae bacterium]
MNTIAHTHRQLANELLTLEATLRHLELWHSAAPSPLALASTAPFACDTLLFTEWLQFIFIPRLSELARTEAPLPTKCDVTPMAEEYFRGRKQHCPTVLAVLNRIDRLITNR